MALPFSIIQNFWEAPLMQDPLIDAIIALNDKKTLEIVRFLRSESVAPTEIIERIQKGIVQVGELYQKKHYYLADLIMAGLIFKDVLKLKEMKTCSSGGTLSKRYTILLGTVKNDMHDIGKELFMDLAQSSGFHVIDLGVDVAPEVFLNQYYQTQADIIALSGILTQSIQEMNAVIRLFEKSGERGRVKFLIGGYPVTADACTYTGADAFAADIKQGVEICQSWCI